MLKSLFAAKGAIVHEGHAMLDHVHLCVSIPPRESVARVVGFAKGKSATHIYTRYLRKSSPFEKHFWSRGYFISTVGVPESAVRRYIRDQELREIQEELHSDRLTSQGPSRPHYLNLVLQGQESDLSSLNGKTPKSQISFLELSFRRNAEVAKGAE